MRALAFMILASIIPVEAQIVAIAHRGEHLQHAENTLPAFAEAIRVGADFFELDVRTSSDGKLVLSHDATVDRCTKGTGRVDQKTQAELEALGIPTFDQALDLARGKIGVYVDIKAASAEDLLSHIQAHGMASSVVMYCAPQMCKQLQGLKVMPEAGSVAHCQMLVDQFHPKVIAFDQGDFKPEIIAVAKGSKALVYVDVMGKTDAPEGWQAAIDAGADGLQTDRPGPLVEWLRQKGYRK